MADSTLPLYLMAMVSTMLVLYNFIAIYCCPRPLPGASGPAIVEETTAANVVDQPAVVQADLVIGDLIPAHTYCKGTSGGLVGEEGACAVCLSEFEEGEALRTLPECLHSFHAACIDMWLLKHPNCPICRANQLAS